jgi:hypothetical protein
LLRLDCGLVGAHLGRGRRSHHADSARCWPNFGAGTVTPVILSIAEAIHQRLLLPAVDLDHCAINEMR